MSGSVSNLQVFNVSTLNRQVTSSDTDNFNMLFDVSNIEMYTHISVLDIQIPKSWYVVRDPLNTFILNENGIPTTITIPEGNYTNIQLFQALQDQLNANSPAPYVYTVREVNTLVLGDFPVPDLNKIRIDSTAPPLVPISLIFDDTTSIMSSILGYNNGINLINGPGSSPIAPLLYNLNFESEVYLTSNAVNADSQDNNFSNATLAVVNVANTLYLSYVFQKYDIIQNMKKLNKNSQIFNFNLQTANAFSSFFLNDVDMQFTIAFFTYTPNINYYAKSIGLLELNTMR